ncbi:putative F420-0 ABC transporter substrate-binding protein [Occultella glacieicola]|uniref:F420-0 ABC transporter substrate-binding protein n=1 Tax=Occultella glacieicola TaxID=2518684 RepID=A0ABY2E8C8_9MICO|nr:putative F420-0 ABC transporter substrate-binding protein [Occultella glacieicola]TDE97238.1 putative F420-0 ABC transporter substrate-binding protein [Occultella glacieicola]
MSHARPVAARPAAALPLVLALAACSGGAAPDPPGAVPQESTVQAEVGYPVTVDNCGTEVSLEAPPERIVTIKSAPTEMVLALGLGDRLVGTAFADGPLPDDLADAGADVPVLAEQAPSSEVVLSTEPDLVYAGWESNLSAETAGDRTALADLGVATYVSPAACLEEGYQPDPLTFDGVFADIIEAGDLLGAPDAAADLVAAQQEELAAVAPSDSGLSALWYSSGSDTPYVGAGIGAPQMLMDAIGVENIAADIDDSWSSLSWEAIADAEPDLIILVDSAWNTAEYKIGQLEANPTTAALPAVQEGRYLIVDFPATEAGVRSVPAATELADQLAQLESGPGS